MLTLSKPHHAIINRAPLADTTKRQYTGAIDRLIEAGIDPRDRKALQTYADTLPASVRSFLKAGLKLLFEDQIRELKAQANPDNVTTIQAFLYRLEAIESAIQTKAKRGTKTHRWLSPEQVEELTTFPRDTATDRRDWITLALLLYGLRRDEAASLTFDRVQTVPGSKGAPVHLLNVTGKGNKDRTVPISKDLFDALMDWQREAGDGYVLRSVDAHGNINHSLSGQAVQDIVRKYGATIDIPDLNPHDLRRTFGHLIYAATRDIMLTMTLLGHSDPKVTMRYLNLALDLDRDITQYIPLGGNHA